MSDYKLVAFKEGTYGVLDNSPMMRLTRVNNFVDLGATERRHCKPASVRKHCAGDRAKADKVFESLHEKDIEFEVVS